MKRSLEGAGSGLYIYDAAEIIDNIGVFVFTAID
jgi:hypothetical protein